MAERQILTVNVDAPYDVIIGRALLDDVVGALPDADRIAVIHPTALTQTAGVVADAFRDIGRFVITIETPDAEAAKTSEVLAYCWTALGQSNFTRSDAIVAVGGGATTDLAGFVAATWLRGVKVVHVPTTVLAMVDAAVGGKTGINTVEGKNLVGAFHHPTRVVCDLNALETLPANDLAAGMAEVVKCGFIADERILEIVEADPSVATSVLAPEFTELLSRAITVKADVVAEDFTEQRIGGLGREILNYGHTLGHAIERTERYKWRHGAAVSVGMVFVAELSRLAGRSGDDLVDRHRSVLESLGLPTTYRGDRWPQLMEAMAIDKKARGSLLRFIILERVGKPAVLEGPDPALLLGAYGEISR